MVSIEKRASSLTNASVVRQFLFAVSLSGVPTALYQKHNLVNNFIQLFISDNEKIYIHIKNNFSSSNTKINYRLFTLEKPKKLKTHMLYIHTIGYYIKLTSHLKLLQMVVKL